MRTKMIAFDETGKPSTTWTYHVESIAFNKVYPPTTFQPVLPPGTHVLDETTGKSSTIPGAPPPKQPSDQPRESSEERPVEAVPPTNWTGAAALILGLVILVVAGYLWWRQR